MKIHLKNFCCWENETFIFPDEGIMLVSAPSGRGKTSIIRAIMFALFGVGTKVIQHGKKGCCVELWFQGLHIVRTKTPGRLIVNDSKEEYEDKAGEHIIKQYFNSMMNLSQDPKNSFVLMSANDRLSYLEHIIFGDVDIGSIKSKIKDIIKTREIALNALKIEHDTIARVLKESQTPSMHFDDVDVENNGRNIDEARSDLMASRKKCRERIHACKRLEELKNDVETKRLFEHQYLEELRECEVGLKALDGVREELTAMKSIKENMIRKERYRKLKEEYFTQKNAYDATLENDKIDLESKIEALTKKKLQASECKLKKDIEAIKRQIEYRSEMDNIVIEHPPEYFEKLLNKSTPYTCPECNTSLVVENNALVRDAFPSDSIPSKEELERERNKVISKLNRKESLKRQIDFSINVDDLPELEKQCDQIKTDNAILASCRIQLSTIKEKYDLLTRNIQNLHDQCKRAKACINASMNDLDWNDIEDEITELNKKIGAHDHAMKQRLELQSKIQLVRSQIDSLSKKMDAERSDFDAPTEEDIDALDQKIQYYDDLKIFAVHKRHTDQLASIGIGMLKAEQNLSVALQFKEKITEAEALSLTHLIHTANVGVQEYLDAFFEKEPLSASIECFKETKTAKKTQIHIQVQHRGNQVDIQTLSGGERDRVILAFTLAFSDIVQTPIVMLDECVASLDQENAGIVFDCIRSQNKNKLIICVAHQIVTGMFDEIIQL